MEISLSFFEKNRALVTSILETLAIWSDITDFVEVDLKDRKKLERTLERTLVDTDTYVICSYLMYLYYCNDTPITLGRLTLLFDRDADLSVSRSKAAQAKVKSILKRVGDEFGLINYVYITDNGKERYEISPSEKLIYFFENKLLPSYYSSLKSLLDEGNP